MLLQKNCDFLVKSNLILFALVFLFGAFALPQISNIVDEFKKPDVLKESRHIPHYADVQKILDSVAYTDNIETFVNPDIKLVLDFNNKKWTLLNAVHFDHNGDIMLQKNRYGLCTELCKKIYKQIKSLFGEQYKVDFLRVAETDFFIKPESSHYIIHIVNLHDRDQTYFIDPSMHKYGMIQNFFNYAMFDPVDQLKISANSEFLLNSAYPIMIKKGRFLIDFSVNAIDGKFDPNNFILAVSATKKNDFAGRYLFALRVKDGQQEMLEFKELSNWIMPERDYLKLKDKVLSFAFGSTKAE